MRILMHSDFYGTITTTFIRNEVHDMALHHNLLYLTGKVLKTDPGVEVHELPFEQGTISKKIAWLLWKYDLSAYFKNVRYAEKLNREIKKFTPDIIHLHFGLEGLKVLQNLDRPYPTLIHFHGYDASQMLRKACYVRELRRFLDMDHVNCIVVSDYMKKQLMNHDINVSRSHLLRYGIDLDAFIPKVVRNRDESMFVILQVSSLSEKKGHVYALKALQILFTSHPELSKRVKIQFTGDGPEKIKFIQLACELAIDHAVEFLGNCNKEQVIELLNDADCFLHHSITDSKGDEEGIPNSLMEAMAMELPVLSTYHAGIPELVKHGVNGLLCKEKDVNELAHQMFEMLSWKKLPDNRTVIEENYNMKKHNLKLQEIYRTEIDRFHQNSQ